MDELKVFRQYSDDCGETHCEAFTHGEIDLMTQMSGAKGWRLHIHPPGTFLDWHPAGGEFIIVVLSGEIEIGYSDDTKMLCKPGAIRFTSDAGKGHTGRVRGDKPCMVLMVDISRP